MQWWYSLVELLPFEWAAPGGAYFFKNALLAVLVVSPLFGLVSTMTVMNRMSFFSDALGHSAFTGMVIGALAGLAAPSWCACIFAAVFAVLFTAVRTRTTLPADTVVGVFSSTAVALGIFLATLGGGSFTRFNKYLIGDILSITGEEIALCAALLLAVAAVWALGLNKLTLLSANASLAKSRGISAFWWEALFSAVVAVAVTVSMQWVGIMVINAFIMLPAAAARNIAKNMRQYHAFSVAGALVCGIAGLMVSYSLGSSAGACISLCLAIYFVFSFLFRRKA